jgi:hypothetical protein
MLMFGINKNPGMIAQKVRWTSYVLGMVVSIFVVLLLRDEVFENLGKVVALRSAVGAGNSVLEHRMYGIGLRASGDRAQAANWAVTAGETDGIEHLGLAIDLLELSQQRALTGGALWLARLHLLSGNTQEALSWANRASSVGISGGTREEAYILDALGHTQAAVTAYQLADSQMSRNFLVANYVALADKCVHTTCKDDLMRAILALDPRNPTALWHQVRSGKFALSDFPFLADWNYQEPRLQREMATIVGDMVESGVTLATAEDYLLHWLSQGSLIAASTLLDMMKDNLLEEDGRLWSARLAAQQGYRTDAYDILYGSLAYKENEFRRASVVRELAGYAYAMALTQEDPQRASLLVRSKGWLEEYLGLKPDDVIAQSELEQLDNLLQGQENGEDRLTATALDQVLDMACSHDGQLSEVGPQLLPENASSLDFWEVAKKSGDPYAKGVYDYAFSSLTANSLEPALHLYGLTIAEQGEYWPSWIGFAPAYPLENMRRSEIYVFSFAYRTDYREGWKRTQLVVTPHLELWLPDSSGDWIDYAYVIPGGEIGESGFAPTLRLYHTRGSVYFRDFSLRAVSLGDSGENCEPLGRLVGRSYDAASEH